MKKLQDTDPRVQEAIVLYTSGLAVRPICEKLKMDSTSLRRILIEKGLLRTKAEAIQKGKSKVDIKHDVLDLLTPEALYWIGFLYADGHIEKDRPRISLTLTKIDTAHLLKFKEFFGTGLKVRTLGSGYLRVAFSSQKIYDRLIELGFSNRKSYNIIPHRLIKTSKDFWRGCIDGDGWICSTGVNCIGLCGHENTINDFLEFIKLSGISHKATCRKVKKRENLWQCDLRAQNVVKQLITLLYKDSTVHLERKYDQFKTFI
jgi:hypothetical protein